MKQAVIKQLEDFIDVHPQYLHLDNDNLIVNFVRKIITYGGEYGGKYGNGAIGVACDHELHNNRREISICLLDKNKSIVFMNTHKILDLEVEKSLQYIMTILQELQGYAIKHGILNETTRI